MNLDLTEAQQLVQRTARDFATREIEPLAAELDRGARWPAEIVARMGELGFLGMTVPAEHGGAGLDHVSFALVVEEISAACAGSGAIVTVNDALFCEPLSAFGSAWQKREILAPTAAGKMLGALGLDDPSGTTEARPARTVAAKQGDGSFVLDGSKVFVTAGAEAEHVIVLALTDPERQRHSTLLVRRGAPGVTLSKPDEKMGFRAAPSCTVFFEDVRVPAEHLLGGEGDGLEVAVAALDAGRIGTAAQAVGIARAAFEKAAAHVRERSSLAKLQSIQFMLSDMAVEIDAARLLTLRAARMKDVGAPHGAESAMAKLFASEMATRVTHKAVQVFGSGGYTAEHGVERHYRDARITELREGSSEIQRMIIAESMVGPPRGTRPGEAAQRGVLAG